MSIDYFLQEIEDKFQDEILDRAHRVTADQLGLDDRAGHVLWVTEERDAIIASAISNQALEYYGGFEYVNKEAVATVGCYTIYRVQEDDDRVARCIEHFEEEVLGQ